ncbi:YlxR family protein [Gordonia sp. ABSL11-1]|uniref:YlxR family protein n=1 Tax=Gordonia sp. ABSL11-1 TaxID=3053924 RepID=UPI00257401FA|nr:YlxR family protein [Gordonia sp. ABSL11-1]MDL9944784.1 YlxR family protein [Gordonia sp. ABSL11-1]
MVQRSLSTPPEGRALRTGSHPRGPVRTCVGCRQRAEATDLVRVVAVHGDGPPGIVVDAAKTMPGRGAWLHPQRDCLSAAVRRRAFPSALRVPGLTVDPDDLAEAIGGITAVDGHSGRNR